MDKLTETQLICENTLRKLISDRDALLVIAKRVYAELDNIYDVDCDNGRNRESPFSGAGELMTSLRRVIERTERP